MFTVSLQLTAGAARFITSGALARIEREARTVEVSGLLKN